MIMYRDWYFICNGGLEKYYWEGWFLLGIIPLYLKKTRIKW